jgi:hypothetical protein
MSYLSWHRELSKHNPHKASDRRVGIKGAQGAQGAQGKSMESMGHIQGQYHTQHIQHIQHTQHILPPYDAEENSALVKGLIDARARQRETRRRKFIRGVQYILQPLTGDKSRKPLQEDELCVLAARGVEDLVLAARCGNFLDCLDLLFHPTHPVSPNEKNEDGVSATYTTLMMILSNEVLDSEAPTLHSSLQERMWLTFFEPRKARSLELVLRVLLFAHGDTDIRRVEGIHLVSCIYTYSIQ